MDTRIQILDDAVCISLNAYTIGNVMSQTNLHSYGQILGLACSLTVIWQRA